MWNLIVSELHLLEWVRTHVHAEITCALAFGHAAVLGAQSKCVGKVGK